MPPTPTGTEGASPRLKAAIADLGITRAEAARRLDIPRQSLHSILSGRRNPSLDWLHAAAATLGIDPAALDDRLAPRQPT